MQDAAPPLSSAPQQDQFLQILSRDAAEAGFLAALRPRPLGVEELGLDLLLGRVLGRDVAAPVDAPPFDRAMVDGFAVRAADLFDASDAEPVRLRLNAEVIHCGTAPGLPVMPGTATPIATGGPIPRGADAVVMIEHTEPEGDGIAVARALAPEPDVLLLDEPTNHLDLPAIEWLEAELKSFRGALVLISHDRRFLETLSRATVWLDRGQARRIEQGRYAVRFCGRFRA